MTEINKKLIYKKLATIQGKVKEITKTKENAFGKYKYFGEADAIKEIKPLMDAEKVSLTWSDSQDPSHFIYEYKGDEKDKHIMRYLKIATLADENDSLTFYIWAMGQDSDIAKAKGKAETYAYKYFLSKFFMVPMVDNLDPDQQGSGYYNKAQQQSQARSTGNANQTTQKTTTGFQKVSNPDGSTSFKK